MKIIGWNINQRSGSKQQDMQDTKIPVWVSDEINRLKPEIAVITEFYRHPGWVDDLAYRLSEYNVFFSNNPDGNEVLIAIKKELKVTAISEMPKHENAPNFLQVGIEYQQTSLIVIGTRIRYDVKKRKTLFSQEYPILKDYLNQLDGNIICVGDFNAWHNPIKKDLPNGFFVSTPLAPSNIHESKAHFINNGETIYSQHKWSYIFENGDHAPLDHLLYKGISVSEIDYSWDFRELHPHIYKDKNGDDIFNPDPPYPDHAILLATLEFQSK